MVRRGRRKPETATTKVDAQTQRTDEGNKGEQKKKEEKCKRWAFSQPHATELMLHTGNVKFCRAKRARNVPVARERHERVPT